eukprot:1119608_1
MTVTKVISSVCKQMHVDPNIATYELLLTAQYEPAQNMVFDDFRWHYKQEMIEFHKNKDNWITAAIETSDLELTRKQTDQYRKFYEWTRGLDMMEDINESDGQNYGERAVVKNCFERIEFFGIPHRNGLTRYHIKLGSEIFAAQRPALHTVFLYPPNTEQPTASKFTPVFKWTDEDGTQRQYENDEKYWTEDDKPYALVRGNLQDTILFDIDVRSRAVCNKGWWLLSDAAITLESLSGFYAKYITGFHSRDGDVKVPILGIRAPLPLRLDAFPRGSLGLTAITYQVGLYLHKIANSPSTGNFVAIYNGGDHSERSKQVLAFIEPHLQNLESSTIEYELTNAVAHLGLKIFSIGDGPTQSD